MPSLTSSVPCPAIPPRRRQQAKCRKQASTSTQIVESLNSTSASSTTSDPPPTIGLPTPDEPDPKAFRPRSNSHHLHPSQQPAPSRWWLRTQATFWRTLMSCSSKFLHDRAPPRPPIPAFTRSIATTYDGPHSPPIILHFYVPPDYFTRIKAGHRYPVVINFHGGGFCLGNATDDRYWANVVLHQSSSVFVSVDYHRAPEFPFPTPLDDSVDAVLYLSAHAADLGLDTTRTALSGFSAGANLAFSVPLRLTFHTQKGFMSTANDLDPNLSRRWPTTQKLLQSFNAANNLQIVNITSFYPLLDWSASRSSKRRTSLHPSKTLPNFFSKLFDYSYLPPPDTMLHASPFVSPGLAPDNMLIHGLPDDIQLFLCGWDMLLREGEVFAGRLRGLGKKVRLRLVEGVVHGWDKHPNPWRDQAGIDRLYGEACGGLRGSFGVEKGDGDGEEAK